MSEKDFDRYRFGENIKYCRKHIGLSQEELAKRIGTTKQQISLYEQGKRTPDAEKVFKLIQALQANPRYLLGLSPLVRPFDDAIQLISLALDTAKRFPEDFKDMYGMDAETVIPGLEFIKNKLLEDKKQD